MLIQPTIALSVGFQYESLSSVTPGAWLATHTKSTGTHTHRLADTRRTARGIVVDGCERQSEECGVNERSRYGNSYCRVITNLCDLVTHQEAYRESVEQNRRELHGSQELDAERWRVVFVVVVHPLLGVHLRDRAEHKERIQQDKKDCEADEDVRKGFSFPRVGQRNPEDHCHCCRYKQRRLDQ